MNVYMYTSLGINSSTKIIIDEVQKYSNFNIIPFSNKNKEQIMELLNIVDSNDFIMTINPSHIFYLKKKCKCALWVISSPPSMAQSYKKMDEPIISISQYAYTWIKKMSGKESKILRVGIDFDRFNYKEKPNRKSIFGMSYLRQRKGRKGVDIMDDIRSMGIKTKIKVGDQTVSSYSNMAEFYQSIDCLIVNSPDDGRDPGCRPQTEAGACGTTIISTNVGTGCNIIKKEMGHIVGSKQELLQTVRQYKDNNSKLVKMGKSYYQELRKNWDWKIVIKEWDEYFKRIENEK